MTIVMLQEQDKDTERFFDKDKEKQITSIKRQLHLSTKVVILGIEEADEGGVDGSLLGHLDGTVTEDLENLALVVVDVGLKHTGQTLQVTLQG